MKQSLYDGLLEVNDFEVPLAMINSEISNMKQDTARRIGMDPKDMNPDLFQMIPSKKRQQKSKNRHTFKSNNRRKGLQAGSR